MILLLWFNIIFSLKNLKMLKVILFITFMLHPVNSGEGMGNLGTSVKTLPFLTFRRILEASRFEWRNWKPRRISLLERGSKNINIIYDNSVPRVGIEYTTCRSYSRTVVLLHYDQTSAWTIKLKITYWKYLDVAKSTSAILP